MKLKLLALMMVVALTALGGCLPLPGDATVAVAVLLSDAPYLNKPLFGAGDDWTVVPGNEEFLSFEKGKDQYGNPVGVISSEWEVVDVTIRSDEKAVDDTIFKDFDAFTRRERPNRFFWYPLYTALVDLHGDPYSLTGLTNYPYESTQCRGDVIPEADRHHATITARAYRDTVFVEFELPDYEGETYTLNTVGFTPTSSNTIRIHLNEARVYRVECSNGEGWDIEIPVDWFWATGTWRIEVMATGRC